ncbi:hypothetical protein QYR09_08105 [Cellulophaga lytica]|nr:hypothetical protein QYR09_08105 [Cellulophaga lytica]
MKFHVIEKQEKFKKFNDSQLLSEIDKEYNFDLQKSNNKIKVFSRIGLNKAVKNTYLGFLISLTLHVIALVIIFNIDNDSEGLTTIGSIIVLSAMAHSLIMISLPFWFQKELIFDLDKKLIQTKSLIGRKTTRVNLDNIYRIVQNIDTQYSYYTFRERKNDYVAEKSPIFAVKTDNSDTKTSLDKLFQESFPDIILENI